MQPSKIEIDYIMEMNRLFPKTPRNDMHTPTPTFQSRFRQTPNYSSSSTDSFSPETFPELSFRPVHRPEIKSETPVSIARRPIVGRKILGNPEQKTIEPSIERLELPIKHWEHTPPRGLNNNTRNYELFPENKAYEFKTPSTISPGSSMYQSSPSNFGMCTTPYLTMANSPTPMSPVNLGASTSRYPEVPQKMCTFCRKNGERQLVYMSHFVKEKRDHRNIVTCPILRAHVCSVCGVSGDNAHTMTYCPVLRSRNNGVPLKSTTIYLKNTRVKSDGRRRY